MYASPLLSEAAGYRIEAIDAGQLPYPHEYVAYRVLDLSGSLAPLEFDAFRLLLLPDGTLIIATPPVDFQPQAGAFATSQRWGMSNIFEVDPRTGDATFIASARTSVPNSPFAASERYIVWTENYCNINPNLNDSDGRTRIYDRDTRILTELDAGLFVTGITLDGELADGTFGPDALIDIESLTYTVKFPTNDRVWSDDYRYTAVGQTGGHGGLCGA